MTSHLLPLGWSCGYKYPWIFQGQCLLLNYYSAEAYAILYSLYYYQLIQSISIFSDIYPSYHQKTTTPPPPPPQTKCPTAPPAPPHPPTPPSPLPPLPPTTTTPKPKQLATATPLPHTPIPPALLPSAPDTKI